MTNNFIQFSKEKFQFIEIKYGAKMEVISNNELKWHYENYSLRIIYDNRRSYELGILLSNDEDASPPFDLHELARYADIASGDSAFQASTETRLEMIIDKMAKLLLLVCNQIPLFSLETMKKLQQQREKECHEYAKRNKLERMRIDAEKAWKEKNYAEIKALYEPFLDDLSKSELKKYEYALRSRK